MKRRRRKVMTTVYLDQGQAEDLELLSSYTKVPQAEYIRQGLAWALARNEDALLLAGQRRHGLGTDEVEETLA